MMRSGQQVSHPENHYQALLQEIMALSGLDPKGVAQYLGTSYIAVTRWIRGDIEPSADTIKELHELLAKLNAGLAIDLANLNTTRTFASRGIRKKTTADKYEGTIVLRDEPGSALPT